MARRLEVKVIPGAREEKVEEGSPWIVRVKARPEKGKANEAVLKTLKKHFGKSARIVAGFTSRKKIVEIGE